METKLCIDCRHHKGKEHKAYSPGWDRCYVRKSLVTGEAAGTDCWTLRDSDGDYYQDGSGRTIPKCGPTGRLFEAKL
jgi:hypothetical protein